MDHELTLTREQMKELGYRVVDLITEHWETLRGRPVGRTLSRAELESLFRESIPEKPRLPGEVLRRVEQDVLRNIVHLDHPRNFGFVPGPSNFVGALADFLASGLNVFAGTWLEASGPAEVELVTIDWLKSLCGFPDAAGGLFVSGGSEANLTALMVAREEKLSRGISAGMAYFSDQTHSSVERAFKVLGFHPGQLRELPADEGFRLDVSALEEAIRSDRRKGFFPFAIVANAGTTNTGAVDPLPDLAELARREGLWLHTDGAFGAAAVLSSRAALLDGLSECDSLTLDPHKWLFQPFAAGTVILKDGALLEKHFRILPEYLRDVEAAGEEVNFCDRGIQLTRSFRALKLWMTFQVFGLENVRRAVERGIESAERAEALLRAREEFEIVSEARLGIVAFRALAPAPADADDFNRRLAAAMIQDGFALVTSTVLRGRTVLRMCPINPRTTESDLESAVDRIAELARRLS